ncbi:MAG TPA: hypothetical protein GXX30_11075 [Firmicutes bacterium]|nr:hypothetical protein [Candidatus Fermentithermobacillaceae bacterium]
MPNTVSSVSETSYRGQEDWSSRISSSLEDQFMKILVTQLRYQDPMEPLKEKDFFAQMAQFSSASQIEKLNQNVLELAAAFKSFEQGRILLEASRLLGQAFTAETEEGIVSGLVEAVALNSGKVVLRSGGREIPLENLKSIGGPEIASQGS